MHILYYSHMHRSLKFIHLYSYTWHLLFQHPITSQSVSSKLKTHHFNTSLNRTPLNVYLLRSHLKFWPLCPKFTRPPNILFRTNRVKEVLKNILVHQSCAKNMSNTKSFFYFFKLIWLLKLLFNYYLIVFNFNLYSNFKSHIKFFFN
jgi:hypothetical protein